LDHGDAVEGRVKLPVPASVEAVGRHCGRRADARRERRFWYAAQPDDAVSDAAIMISRGPLSTKRALAGCLSPC
jgi:hypothetical protein